MCSVEEAALTALQGISKRTTKWAVLRIPEGQDSACVLEASGAPTGNEEADFDAFRAAVPQDQCRWLVYDLGFQKNGVNNNKIVFVGYVPDACTKMAEKFPYAQHKDDVKSKCAQINKDLQVNDHDDLTYAKFVDEF